MAKSGMRRIKVDNKPFNGSKQVRLDINDVVYIEDSPSPLKFGTDGTKSWVILDSTKVSSSGEGFWIDNFTVLGSGTIEDPVRLLPVNQRPSVPADLIDGTYVPESIANAKPVGVPIEGGSGRVLVYFSSQDFTINFSPANLAAQSTLIPGEAFALPPVGLNKSLYGELESGDYLEVQGNDTSDDFLHGSTRAIKSVQYPGKLYLGGPSRVVSTHALEGEGILRGTTVKVLEFNDKDIGPYYDRVLFIGDGSKDKPLAIYRP